MQSNGSTLNTLLKLSVKAENIFVRTNKTSHTKFFNHAQVSSEFDFLICPGSSLEVCIFFILAPLWVGWKFFDLVTVGRPRSRCKLCFVTCCADCI